MKYFMIGGDKLEYCPVDAELIRQWVRDARANVETLLRMEGETEWKPLRSFPDFENDVPPLPVSAASEPPFVAPRDVHVRVGHSFAQAWHLVGQHFGTVAVASFLVWLLFTITMYAPCLGLLAMLFYGPLFGGLYMFFLKLIREGDASPGDVFTLTREAAMPLMMTGLLSLILVQFGFVFCILPGVYLFIAWVFSLPLIADRGLSFWDAMETSRRVVTRHWFKIFALFVLSFLPFVGFHIYLRVRETMDMIPHVEKMVAILTQVFSGGTPNQAEMQNVRSAVEEVQRGYGGWRLFRQFLLLIALPFGVGSLAFVYEDLFGRKK